MIRTFICLLSLLVAAPAVAQNAAIEQEIRDLEAKYNAAYAANDLNTYFSYLAPDFSQWLTSGRTDKAQYVASWTKYISSGNKVLSVALSDVKVQVSPAGDSAVFSYLLKVKTQTAKGVSEEANQETDVWFKRDGAWKIVFLHYSPSVPRRAPQP